LCRFPCLARSDCDGGSGAADPRGFLLLRRVPSTVFLLAPIAELKGSPQKALGCPFPAPDCLPDIPSLPERFPYF
jgi:hypothetical protein